MLRSIQASRSALVRLTQRQLPARTFTARASLQADFVQDLYLKEVRNFKPTPLKPNDAEGHVHKFAPPKAPNSPEEAQLAEDLQAYEAQTVEVEGQADQGEVMGKEEDWFEDEEEAEDIKGATH